MLVALAVAFLAPVTSPLAARADDDGSTAAGAGVARLSVVDGTVGIARGDSNATSAGVINAPVLGADYVTTGPQSRAEVQFDATAVVRLGQNVQMRLSRIDADDRRIQLAAGTIDLRLLRGTDGRNAIDTPSISIVPKATGSYRVAVDDDGTTFVTVRSGYADIETPQGAQRLDPGTTLMAQGAASDPRISPRDEIAADDFDAFNRDRDRLAFNALADASYAGSTIDGIGELDTYGRWVDDGSYGRVWIPANVAPGWAPYRTGTWVWEGGYGWTWVAAEPWGWAPYHYGRWYFSAAYHNWCWYPPARAAFAPAWSPALVGFVGLSIGAVSLGVGFGHIGWVPLAPHESFHPWWGPHATAIVTNTYVNNTYVNGGNHLYRNMQDNGMTSVSVDNFRAGRFASPASGAVPVRASAFAGTRFAQQEAVPRQTFDRPSYAAAVATNQRADRGYHVQPSYRSDETRPSYRSYQTQPAYRSYQAQPMYRGYQTQPAYRGYQAPSQRGGEGRFAREDHRRG